MNSELRKAVYRKQMFRSKFEKNRSDKNWEKFRKQRNLVTKLKRKSIKSYFLERCVGGEKSSDFWPTIKPFLSKKCKSGDNTIVLNENDKILNDPKEISNTFNEFYRYVNVANDIGKDVNFDKDNHCSLNAINLNVNLPSDSKFEFKPAEICNIDKIVKNIGLKKASGVDTLPAKLLKAGSPVINQHICELVNQSIDTGIFPDKLKRAQVTPLFKKDDPLAKKNYRPVSILPIISKIYEKVLSVQLSDYFDNIFHNFLCAFRKGHGCQTTLLRLLEDWKSALDQNLYVAAILMDLSKAFDCLPHDILLCKLSAYGLSSKSINLLGDYLTGRFQQVKIKGVVSSWAGIKKGVPQGSILGPLLFNAFINDIFYFIKEGTLYNYADDNTLSFCHENYDKLVSVLQEESNVLIDWFKDNCMQANPSKFQAIAVGAKTFKKEPVFKIESAEIVCEKSVKLLGIDIDFKLNFEQHVSNICRKAAQQLNVLKRIGPYLSKINKLTIFYSFILSHFNFCPMAWHFCSKTSTNKMEKIQERALRFIYDDPDSSYEELLPSLEIRRLRTMAIECFKIIHDLSPPCLSNLVSPLIASDIQISWTSPELEQLHTVKSPSNLQLLFFGMTCLNISELKQIFYSSKVSSHLGMERYVNVVLAQRDMCAIFCFGLFSLHVINWLKFSNLLCFAFV